jgi:hypothetical protein
MFFIYKNLFFFIYFTYKNLSGNSFNQIFIFKKLTLNK